MKFMLRGLIIGILVLSVYAPVMAENLKGTVVSVFGLDVTVKIDGEQKPAVGDEMVISSSRPDGESLIGTWEITDVLNDQARASVKVHTGNPTVGNKVIIFSNGMPRSSESQNTKPENVNTNTSDEPDTPGVSSEVQELVEKLRSANPGIKRNAAKIACKNFTNNETVVSIAAEELEKGYSLYIRDNHHVDAMAWLCNLLGASNDRQYLPLLKKVYRKSPSKKIMNYARKNYYLLKR